MMNIPLTAFTNDRVGCMFFRKCTRKIRDDDVYQGVCVSEIRDDLSTLIGFLFHFL